MRETAYILFIIGTVLCGIFLIPLTWMIPMTIMTKNSIDDNKEHIALGVCQILFMPFGIVSGILILIPEENQNQKELNVQK
ncbi:hypothetical protein [Spiroplasma endosymbiont of Atherix ibis]|uniref:hypothetical protein n=1 Tax=Spiroplasma endosymbiont of Atherix ibis TaxID=3066291 RepID=UPI0030CEB325